MSDFDKTLHAQLRHLIDDLTVAVDDDGHTRYAPKNTLMFSNFIGALIELMPTLAARAQPAQAAPDVVRDAAPIPDHELVTMYDERPTSDLEMIEFAREVERRHGIGVQPQHITDGSPCWCNPDVAYTDPETGASVIVHRRPQ